MDKITKLYNLVFDKLVDNTSHQQFDPEMADKMGLFFDIGTGRSEYIEMEIDGTTYKLTITPTTKEEE